MKALRLARVGQLELQDVPEPQVGPDDVLIRIRAAGICGTDVHMVREGFPGVVPPLTLGHEFAGEIAALGSAVQGWRLGERVTGENVISCGHCRLCRDGRHELCPQAVGPGFSYDGAMAEYLAQPARLVHRLPDTLSWEEGAAIEPSASAPWTLRRGRLAPGERIAIVGDGFIGLAMVRMARIMGAAGVAMVGHHEYRLRVAAQLGADLTINSWREGPVPRVLDWTSGEGCDLAVEAGGGAEALRQALGMVALGGRVVVFGLPDPRAAMDLSKVVLGELDVIGALGHPNCWQETIGLMGRRELDVSPLLTHAFPLDRGLDAFALASAKADDCIKVQLCMP